MQKISPDTSRIRRCDRDGSFYLPYTYVKIAPALDSHLHIKISQATVGLQTQRSLGGLARPPHGFFRVWKTVLLSPLTRDEPTDCVSDKKLQPWRKAFAMDSPRQGSFPSSISRLPG